MVRCEKGNQTCEGSGEKEGDKGGASKKTAGSKERCSLGELLATRVHTENRHLLAISHMWQELFDVLLCRVRREKVVRRRSGRKRRRRLKCGSGGRKNACQMVSSGEHWSIVYARRGREGRGGVVEEGWLLPSCVCKPVLVCCWCCSCRAQPSPHPTSRCPRMSSSTITVSPCN